MGPRLSLLLAALSAAYGAVQPPLDTPASAEACGRCHRAIHEAWKSSAHAGAMESRLFQDALEITETEFGADSRKVCLECHSPIAFRTADFRLRRKVSWEGVTCDYCHSVRDVTFDGPNPKARVEFTQIKSGPLQNVTSVGHETVYSAVHITAAVCAPCHDYRNALGFPVLTTYSEWKASRYAKEGRACQSCHMSRVEGEVVDPRIQQVALAKINLHSMPGSHSVEQLTSTVKANLTTERRADGLHVFVDVANVAAGHSVPTGSPLRQIVLEVKADAYDGKHFREQRVYRRTVADQEGKEIDREPVAFLRAASVISDTRLAPGEKRRESFAFAIPAGTSAQISATFWYYYSPLARTEAQKRITFLTLQQLVK
ncbi:MAG TPA: multiheme c-type cytochrome [Bryobacteraceae bacterium]|nr:multiheme c-type cytochrome [Bryobacteraceae bacterium]